MTNWVTNVVLIKAAPNKIVQLKEFATRAGKFDFKTFHLDVPINTNYVWMLDETECREWPSDVEINQNLGQIYMTYESAWQANSGSIKKIRDWLEAECPEYYLLMHAYNESAMCFCGFAVYSNGQTESINKHYPSSYTEVMQGDWDNFSDEERERMQKLAGIENFQTFQQVQKIMQVEDTVMICPLDYAEVWSEIINS